MKTHLSITDKSGNTEAFNQYIPKKTYQSIRADRMVNLLSRYPDANIFGYPTDSGLYRWLYTVF